MDCKKFDEIVAKRLDACSALLAVKGEEYSRGGDRLWNFKRAGEHRRCSPAKALLGMKVKHDVSIDDIVDRLDNGIIPSPYTVAEKINDSINYLLLLEGLIEELRSLVENGPEYLEKEQEKMPQLADEWDEVK